MVELADRVERRADDIFQISALAAYTELAFLEKVLLKNIRAGGLDGATEPRWPASPTA
jgi:hypothetical protein